MTAFNIVTLEAYFENLAAQHVDFNHIDANGKRHFFPFRIEEWMKDLNNMSSPAMMIEMPEGRFFDNDADQIFDEFTPAMSIMGKLKDIENQKQRASVLQDTKGWMQDFMSRIRRDSRDDEGHTLAKRFHLDEIPYQQMGPFTHWIGWRCELPLQETISLAYNPVKWTDS